MGTYIETYINSGTCLDRLFSAPHICARYSKVPFNMSNMDNRNVRDDYVPGDKKWQQGRTQDFVHEARVLVACEVSVVVAVVHQLLQSPCHPAKLSLHFFIREGGEAHYLPETRGIYHYKVSLIGFISTRYTP